MSYERSVLSDERHDRRYALWLAGGLALVGLHVVLALLSARFAYGADPLAMPVIALVGILICAGVVYLLIACRPITGSIGRGLVWWMIAVGAVLRAIMLPTTPILETDFYRYLWDGAVVVSGQNPYAHSLEQVLSSTGADRQIPTELHQLADEAGATLGRINHPHLRTIYPPVAQAAFAAAYLIKPWSLVAWRVVLLVFDVAVLVLLIATLRAVGLSVMAASVYWWNPLLIITVFNAGHMDLIAFPFVLGSLLLVVRNRYVLASGVLAIALGAKLWPVVLLPIVLRPLLARPARLAAALLVFAAVGGVMLYPLVATGLDSTSGLAVYSRSWQLNDALYKLFVWTAHAGLTLIGAHAYHSQLVARVAVVCVLVIWLVWLCRRAHANPRDLCQRCLLAVTALFLLSPAQFPWYYTWLVPLLAVRPRFSLLLLTVLLPLYYLRYHLAARGHVELFDYGVVWLEYVPVWCLLIYEAWQQRRRPTPVTASPAM
jgi:hypothetical protein